MKIPEWSAEASIAESLEGILKQLTRTNDLLQAIFVDQYNQNHPETAPKQEPPKGTVQAALQRQLDNLKRETL